MIQVNNGYAEYYYLLSDGRIYNADKKEYIEPNCRHQYKLRTIDDKYKSISLKTLYNIVFNKQYCKDDIDILDGEEWKEIEDTNGLYYISNKGRVKSYQGYNAILLKPFKTKGGYCRVDIVQNGKRVSKLVHRLTAAAYLPLPNNIDYQLHHKDFDVNNNSANNLEWLSCQEHFKKHIERSKEDGEARQSTTSEGNNSKERADR